MRSLNVKYVSRFMLLSLLVLLTILLANNLKKSKSLPKLIISKEASAINLKHSSLSILSLGHSRLLSSFLWISTMLESDLEHYQGDANSWMYYRFMTIAKLEPNFYKNYLIGGQYLSIIKDDVYGADDLYSLGLERFPKDFWLSYHAGFNATFEVGDPTLGLKYYDNIYNSQMLIERAPALYSLINKLRLDQQDITLIDAYNSLLDFYSRFDDGPFKDILRNSLYALKAEIDLECLNLNQINCDKVDFDGNRYRKKNELWFSIKPWKPFRIHKKKGLNK